MGVVLVVLGFELIKVVMVSVGGSGVRVEVGVLVEWYDVV